MEVGTIFFLNCFIRKNLNIESKRFLASQNPQDYLDF